MAALAQVRSKLTAEEWRYVGAGALGFVGLVAWAIGFRTLRGAPALLGDFGDRDCPEQVYYDVLVTEHRGAARVAKGAWYYAPTIVAAALHWGVPPDVLMAQAHTESTFQPHAVSGAGAKGLLQVMPSTGKLLHNALIDEGAWPFAELDTTDPAQSAWLGAYLMHRLLHLRGRDLTYALAAYNAGPQAVPEGSPQSSWPAETRNYVRGVKRRRDYYQEIWNRCGTTPM